MGHNDVAFGQDQLDIAQAETEHEIQPNGVADGSRPETDAEETRRAPMLGCELRPSA
jgi:hypothetical protein